MGRVISLPECARVESLNRELRSAKTLSLELRRAQASAVVLDYNEEEITLVEAVQEGIDRAQGNETMLSALSSVVIEDVQIITNQLDGTFLGILSDALARLQ